MINIEEEELPDEGWSNRFMVSIIKQVNNNKG
jgi:hypothetical protein